MVIAVCYQEVRAALYRPELNVDAWGLFLVVAGTLLSGICLARGTAKASPCH